MWLFKKQFLQPLFSTNRVENEMSEKHPQWKLIYIGIGTYMYFLVNLSSGRCDQRPKWVKWLFMHKILDIDSL